MDGDRFVHPARLAHGAPFGLSFSPLRLSPSPFGLSPSPFALSLSKGRTELVEGLARFWHNPSTDGPSTGSVPAQGERGFCATAGSLQGPDVLMANGIFTP